MVATTAFSARSGWSISPGIRWSVSAGTGGQFPPESGGQYQRILQKTLLIYLLYKFSGFYWRYSVIFFMYKDLLKWGVYYPIGS